jgi:hypothetical protein
VPSGEATNTNCKVFGLTHGWVSGNLNRWFSPGILASSTNKTGYHDIVEILLKVPLNTKIKSYNYGERAKARNQENVS